MEVQLFGNKKQATLKIDSEFHSSITSTISRDIEEIKGVVTPLIVSKLGTERLLAKLKLTYSQGIGLRSPEEIEYILIKTKIEGQEIIAIYDLKTRKEKSEIIEIDFFMNTVSIEDRKTVVLSKPVAILCDNFSYFLENETIKKPKIIERFKSEELDRNFDFITYYFSFLILPRNFFSDKGIAIISLKIFEIFQETHTGVADKDSFLQFLYRKRSNYIESSRGIYVQPKIRLESILINYLEKFLPSQL